MWTLVIRTYSVAWLANGAGVSNDVATVPGFESEAACRAAAAEVQKDREDFEGISGYFFVRTDCVGPTLK